ncbi:MAG TPA: MFS transporter [Flavilitoribacter sp.]|nr:MFS transporter [Flavilitoribacter sp.]
MKANAIKVSLYLNYFVFAILLNSVGIVILKVQNIYGIDEVAAATLELFKDLSIAAVSFLVASFLPRIGYKKGMLMALALVTLGCLTMYFGNSFWAARVLFASIGVAFAVIKVSVYSVIGLITEDSKAHNSLMSSIEGFFMFGIALAYFLFPAFNSTTDVNAWLNVYLLLAAMTVASFLFLYFSKFDEGHEIPGSNLVEDFTAMFLLLAKLLVIVFLASAFLFVMIEQGIMTWLPTFNSRVLQLSESLSIAMSSILAISLGVGRMLAGVLTKRISWFWILVGCIGAAMLMVLFVLPKTVGASVGKIDNLADLPLIGYAFPIVGLFIAPIYPLINSAVLSALPKKVHSPMSGLIIIFSALGGTLGSIITGYLFKHLGAEKAFYFTLIPMALLLTALVILRRLTRKAEKAAVTA